MIEEKISVPVSYPTTWTYANCEMTTTNFTNTGCFKYGTLSSNIEMDWRSLISSATHIHQYSDFCTVTNSTNPKSQIKVGSFINRDKYHADLSVIRLSPQDNSANIPYWDQTCFTNGTSAYSSTNGNTTKWRYAITNNSLLPTYNVHLKLQNPYLPGTGSRLSYTYIDRNSIKVNNGGMTINGINIGSAQSSIWTSPPNFIISSIYPAVTTVTGTCNHLNVITTSDFSNTFVPDAFGICVAQSDALKECELDFAVIEPNQLILLEFETVRCCPTDGQLLTNNTGIDFNDWKLSITGHNECPSSSDFQATSYNVNELAGSTAGIFNNPFNFSCSSGASITAAAPNYNNPLYYFTYSSASGLTAPYNTSTQVYGQPTYKAFPCTEVIAETGITDGYSIAIDGCAYNNYNQPEIKLSQSYIPTCTILMPGGGTATCPNVINNVQWGGYLFPQGGDKLLSALGYELFMSNPTYNGSAGQFLKFGANNTAATTYSKLIVKFEMGHNLFIQSSGMPVMRFNSVSGANTIVGTSPSTTNPYSFTASIPSGTYTTTQGNLLTVEFNFQDILAFIKAHTSGITNVNQITGSLLKAYLEQSSFDFTLSAQCSSDGQPPCRVRTYYVPATCGTCEMPLSEVMITPQVLCPGCFLPGMIVTQTLFQRDINDPDSYGLKDDNNNGIADNQTPVLSGTINAPLPQSNKMISGDNVYNIAEGYFWDAAVPYNFATLNSTFACPTCTTGLGNHFFNYLYYECTVPGGGTSDFDFQLNDLVPQSCSVNSSSNTYQAEVWILGRVMNTSSLPSGVTAPTPSHDYSIYAGIGSIDCSNSHYMRTETISSAHPFTTNGFSYIENVDSVYYVFGLNYVKTATTTGNTNQIIRSSFGTRYTFEVNVNSTMFQGSLSTANHWFLEPDQDYRFVCNFHITGNPMVQWASGNTDATTCIYSTVDHKMCMKPLACTNFPIFFGNYKSAVEDIKTYFSGQTANTLFLDPLNTNSLNNNAGNYVYWCEGRCSNPSAVLYKTVYDFQGQFDNSICTKFVTSKWKYSIGNYTVRDKFPFEFRMIKSLPDNYQIDFLNQANWNNLATGSLFYSSVSTNSYPPAYYNFQQTNISPAAVSTPYLGISTSLWHTSAIGINTTGGSPYYPVLQADVASLTSVAQSFLALPTLLSNYSSAPSGVSGSAIISGDEYQEFETRTFFQSSTGSTSLPVSTANLVTNVETTPLSSAPSTPNFSTINPITSVGQQSITPSSSSSSITYGATLNHTFVAATPYPVVSNNISIPITISNTSHNGAAQVAAKLALIVDFSSVINNISAPPVLTNWISNASITGTLISTNYYLFDLGNVPANTNQSTSYSTNLEFNLSSCPVFSAATKNFRLKLMNMIVLPLQV